MSGLRLTSIIGNAWNTVVTEAVRILLVKCKFETPKDNYIRGDDSTLIFDEWESTSAAHQFYGVIGALSTPGKFAVLFEQTEFLRVEYVGSCKGYPMRAIPGLTQRKPWSNEPWTDIGVIKSLYDTVNVLRRRGLNMDRAWRTLRGAWSQKHQIPTDALQVPTQLGGFGLEPWDGITMYKNTIPKPEPEGIGAKRTTNTREINLNKQFISLGITVDPAILTQMADAQMADTLVADDVPEVARALRDQFNQTLKKHKFIRRTRHFAGPTPRIYNYSTIEELDVFEKSVELEMFGLYPHLAGDFKLLSQLSRFDKRYKPLAWFRENRSIQHHHIHKFKNRFGLPDTLDYLSGTLTFPDTSLHPLAKHFITKDLIRCAVGFRPGKLPLSASVSFAAKIRIPEFISSYVYKRCFQW